MVPLSRNWSIFQTDAMSNLDRRVSSWNFSLKMQTYHNMTIDFVQENLTIEPGDKQSWKSLFVIAVTAKLLDAGLLYEGSREDV